MSSLSEYQDIVLLLVLAHFKLLTCCFECHPLLEICFLLGRFVLSLYLQIFFLNGKVRNEIGDQFTILTVISVEQIVNPSVACLPEPSVEITGCGSSVVTSAFRTEGMGKGWDQPLQSPFNRKEKSFQEPPAFCRQAAYTLKFSLFLWEDWTQYISFVLLKIQVSNFSFTLETLYIYYWHEYRN